MCDFVRKTAEDRSVTVALACQAILCFTGLILGSAIISKRVIFGAAMHANLKVSGKNE